MNKITEWSFDKPTESGMYLCCRGDVETTENIRFSEFQRIDGRLVDQDGVTPHDYYPSFKFARLLVGREAHD